MTFRPSNRTGVAPLGERLADPDGVLAQEWFVDDIDSDRKPRRYCTVGGTLSVMPHGRGWIIVTDRGMFLKDPPRRHEYKGRVKVFRDVYKAALAAEAGGKW